MDLIDPSSPGTDQSSPEVGPTVANPIGKTHLNVLSIDGGGRRGYIPAILLARLEEQLGRPLHEVFDYMAGTSTGGLLALGLAHGNKASALVHMYEDELPAIFARPFWWKLKTLWGLLGPKYPGDGLRISLSKHFLNACLVDALTNVLVTSYSLKSHRPVVTKSWTWHKNMFTKDVAYATAAAPTYFPAGKSLLVDGGVFAQNPSLCILADVCELHPEASVTMVSLGTGSHESGLNKDPGGLLGWATKIPNVLLDGSSDSINYQTKRHPIFRTVGSSLHRFQCDLPDPDTRAMDGVVVPGLRRAAEAMASTPQFFGMVQTLKVKL